jgi:hypothetical protein
MAQWPVQRRYWGTLLVGQRKAPGTTPPGEDGTTVVVRLGHSVQFRAGWGAAFGPLPLVVVPHDLLGVPVLPRPNALCGPRLAGLRLASLGFLSRVPAGLVPVRRLRLRPPRPRVIRCRCRAGALGGLSTRRTVGEKLDREQQATGGQPDTRTGCQDSRGTAATWAARDTAMPRKNANRTAYRARRLDWSPGFSSPTVDSTGRPSTDKGHSEAPTGSAPPRMAKVR